jgi:hypothetical protein
MPISTLPVLWVRVRADRPSLVSTVTPTSNNVGWSGIESTWIARAEETAEMLPTNAIGAATSTPSSLRILLSSSGLMPPDPVNPRKLRSIRPSVVAASVRLPPGRTRMS